MPDPKRVEPGTTLTVGAVYRIVEIASDERRPLNQPGDVVTCITDSNKSDEDGVYAAPTTMREWFVGKAQTGTYVTALELVSEPGAAEPMLPFDDEDAALAGCRTAEPVPRVGLFGEVVAPVEPAEGCQRHGNIDCTVCQVERAQRDIIARLTKERDSALEQVGKLTADHAALAPASAEAAMSAALTLGLYRGKWHLMRREVRRLNAVARVNRLVMREQARKLLDSAGQGARISNQQFRNVNLVSVNAGLVAKVSELERELAELRARLGGDEGYSEFMKVTNGETPPVAGEREQ